MNTEQSIDVLNALIVINNDRIEGYTTASKETEESDLKTLFAQFENTSHKCKGELVKEVQRLGGEVAEGTKTTGKIYRAWMDVKATLTGNDRKAILNSCEYGEDVAIEAYEDALNNEAENISTEQQMMLNAHLQLIKADHDKVKGLRDMLVEHA